MQRLQRLCTAGLLVCASTVLALIVLEGTLRWILFHTSAPYSAIKDPYYYFNDADEYWKYHYLFNKNWAVAERTKAPSPSRNFYDNFGLSLIPDPELGYVRKPNVKYPCHETTNFATRGLHDYEKAGPRILFFGDSFVETNSCSGDSLPSKMEKLLQVDVLNYGVGGYGTDQIYLYFRRIVPTCDREDCLFLIGLIPDDLFRIRLKFRTGPKPYFEIVKNDLVLHTEHIHVEALNDFTLPERSYLYHFVMARLGHPLGHPVMPPGGEKLHDMDAMHLADHILKEIGKIRRTGKFDLRFVLFQSDPPMAALLRENGFPFFELDSCSNGTITYDDTFHPDAAGNDVLARCLSDLLLSQGLVPRAAE
jgi:hypothetical protein